MVCNAEYETLHGRVFTTQPLPLEDSRLEQFQQEEPQPEKPTGCCIPFYFVVNAFTCLGDACMAICSCDEVDAEY